jgi:hypothetical protein
MSSHYATVDHPITKHCPILSARDITPKALIDLEDAYNEYFIAKEINETDKVWVASNACISTIGLLQRERYSSPSNTATL